MPLYSTEKLTNANEGNTHTGPVLCGPEGEKCAENNGNPSWFYLFVHHSKLEKVNKILNEKFETFIHTTIIYTRKEKRIRKEERATIAGLVFVRGSERGIREYLDENFFGYHLAKDCSTGRVAVIPDTVMQSFMKMSQVDATRIRFMPHTFDYYSSGNTLVRITSGPLAGLRGYRIRIARDKCFITSIGGMTVAIGGIYKESFENLGQYVKLRREQLRDTSRSAGPSLTPVQAEIDACFLDPQNQLDLMAVAAALTPLMARAEEFIQKKKFDEAAEVAMFILERTGSRFATVYDDPRVGDPKDITEVCRRVDRVLLSIIGSVDVSEDLKEIVATGRESLMIRFPFLPIDE